MKRILLALAAAVVTTALAAPVQAAPAKGAMLAVIDVEKVMTQSVPGRDGAEHLKKVHEVLQKGMGDLEEKMKKAPQAERDREIIRGQAVLQRQMEAERMAVAKVVGDLMTDAVKEWRVKNDVRAVVARQNLIDADAVLDITDVILVAMNNKKAKFADLPVVSINSPEQPAKPDTKNQAKPGQKPSSK